MPRRKAPHAAGEVWFTVQSSALAEVRRVRSDLEVRFTSGRRYTYRGAGHLLEDLLAAPSKGTFFNSEIKPYFSVR